MGAMKLLEHLLRADPAVPRLTVYTESTGARLDFSAQTLDNWAAKIANFLIEELDLTPGDVIAINLPVSWQAAVIALGAITARIDYDFSDSPPGAEVLFTNPDTSRTRTSANVNTDVVAVTDDPFGRGISELGGIVPPGVIDFGPTVRFYSDHYLGDTPALAADGAPERLLSTGWIDRASFEEAFLAPLSRGGSAVIVAGLASAERLNEIAAREKVTARL